MIGPIDWDRTVDYAMSAIFYLVSVFGTVLSLSQFVHPNPVDFVGVFFGFFFTGAVVSGWYLLKRFGDGIFIGER